MNIPEFRNPDCYFAEFKAILLITVYITGAGYETSVDIYALTGSISEFTRTQGRNGKADIFGVPICLSGIIPP